MSSKQKLSPEATVGFEKPLSLLIKPKNSSLDDLFDPKHLGNRSDKEVTTFQNTKPGNPEAFVAPPFDHVRTACTPVRKNPIENTSFWGKLFYSWVNDLYDRAKKKPFTNRDIFKVAPVFQSELIAKEYKKFEQESTDQAKRSPIVIAKQMIWSLYKFGLSFVLIANCLEFAVPFLNTTLNNTLKKHPTAKEQNLISLGFIASILAVFAVRYFLHNRAMFYLRISGARIAAILRFKLFQKMQRIPESARVRYTESKMLSLMTIDMDNVGVGLLILPDFINSFIILTIGFVYLLEYQLVALVLVGLMALAIAVFRLIHVKTVAYKAAIFEVNDERSRLIKLVLRDIFMIKTCRLEQLFFKSIMKIYDLQNRLARRYMAWDQLATVISFYLPTLFAVVIFGYRILSDNSSDLEENSSYLVLTVLSIMRNPINSIVEGFRRWPNQKASLKRLETFFALPDHHRESEAAGTQDGLEVISTFCLSRVLRLRPSKLRRIGGLCRPA